MGSFGGWEILLIFLVILLVFGAKRIPEIARGLGKGIREFKDATSNIKNELNVDDDRSPRIQQPYQGTTAPRQEPYQTQQAAPPPPPPAQQAQESQARPPSEQKAAE